jgi:integrase
LILLTPEQVAEQLQIKKRTVAHLGMPFVRVGAGKGVRRYRQEDVDAYINLRVHYQRGRDVTQEKKEKRGRVPTGSGQVGIPVLPSRRQLQAIRLGTREEAKAACREKKKELASKPKGPEGPSTALQTVVHDYLWEAAENGRSEWRTDGVRFNFNGVVIPFFGAATPITEITTGQIRKFVVQRKRTVKPKTLWHDVTNMRAVFNWACAERELPDGRTLPALLTKNPVDGLDHPKGALTKLIGNTKPKKSPLDLGLVDQAAAALTHPADRAYFDFLRFTGLRKDEANRLRWDDLRLEEGYFHCRGTKTDEADAFLPLAQTLIESLKNHKATSTSEYVFPGRSAQTRGKKIYSRRRLFESIERLTSRCIDCRVGKIGTRRYCEDCHRIEAVSRSHRCSKCKSVKVNEGVGCLSCGSIKVKAGIKLRPKDMRDYFANTVQTDDPRVLMSLMRHTNLTTTTKYLRAVQERMKDAVRGMGQPSSKTSSEILGATLGATHDRTEGQKRSKTAFMRKWPISPRC